MACGKNCFKILTIIIALADIVVGWFKFYQIYHETGHLEQDLVDANPILQNECSNPQLFWKVYVSFNSLGTILTCFEIYYLIKEIKTDKRMFNKCFSRAFFLVVAIYFLKVFPISILNIVYRDKCVCFEGFSISVWQTEVRDFFKSFLGGVSVICLQIILHLAEIYIRLRRIGRFIKTFVFCVEFLPDEEIDGRTLPCFIISIVLVTCYTALFLTEIVFIFCVKYT